MRANVIIITEIRKLLVTNSGVSFIHECRETNVDAHNIAKNLPAKINIAKNSLELAHAIHVWLLDPLSYVNNVLMQ